MSGGLAETGPKGHVHTRAQDEGYIPEAMGLGRITIYYIPYTINHISHILHFVKYAIYLIYIYGSFQKSGAPI